MYLLLLDRDHLVTSDVERLRLYALDGGPKQIAEVEEVGELPFFDQSPAGERIAAAAGIVARSFTPVGAPTHWTETPTRVSLHAAADLAPIRVLDLGERLDHDSLALSPDGSLIASVRRGAGLVVFDARTGAKLWALPGDIGSGPSWSPDGRFVALGQTDQGGGLLQLIDTRPETGTAPLEHQLPDPEYGSGLNDSPFCSRFTRAGTELIFSTCAWGVAGVVVYDVATRQERWSADMDATGEEDAETWSAPELDLALDDTLVLVGQDGIIRAFRLADGHELSPLEFEPGDSRHFAADSARRGVWITRAGAPRFEAFPADWTS